MSGWVAHNAVVDATKDLKLDLNSTDEIDPLTIFHLDTGAADLLPTDIYVLL